jgi:hypothetical protein
MGQGLKDITMNLRNMVFMRKIRGVSVMNTVEALGIVPDAEGHSLEIERVLAIWGTDPVHPSPAAYRILAGKISEKIEQVLSDPNGEDRPGFPGGTKRKQDPRDAWVSGSQPIAKRAEPSRGIRAHRAHGYRGNFVKRGGFHWHRGGGGRFARKKFKVTIKSPSPVKIAIFRTKIVIYVDLCF